MNRNINNKGDEENKIMFELRKKLNNLNIICTTADKGAGLVLIDKSEYVDKTLEFLTTNNCTLITRDPTKAYITKLKQKHRMAPRQQLQYKRYNTYEPLLSKNVLPT